MPLPTLEANSIPEGILPDIQKDDGASVQDEPTIAQNYDEPIATRRELWSYYLYHFGNNGLAEGYTLTLFQALATAAGFDPDRGPGSSCQGNGKCVLPWGSGTKAVSSIVLIAHGMSFAVMMLVLATISPIADYRMFGRWLLLISTAICWATQFASITLTSPSRWSIAMALYMISFTSNGIILAFTAALFPQLVRNTPHSRELRKRREQGELSPDTYEKEKIIEKNKVSSISMICLFSGDVVALSLNLSLLLPLKRNPRVDNYVIVFTTGYWVLFGIWWFIFLQPRPGPKLPEGENYLTIGWKQIRGHFIFVALKEYKKLPFTFAYILALFLLSDGMGTSLSLVSICQNEHFTFSFLQNTYLGLVRAITSAASVFVTWHVQRYWKIDIKKMFLMACIMGTIIPAWGMIGLWTNKIGFHNAWEFWAYSVVYGLVMGPNVSVTRTMMSELTPPGFEYMFFGLYGLSNRSASVIGPNVVQAIISTSGSIWKAFPVLFVLTLLGCFVAWFGINVPKGRIAAEKWAAEQRATRAGIVSLSEKDEESSESKREGRGESDENEKI